MNGRHLNTPSPLLHAPSPRLFLLLNMGNVLTGVDRRSDSAVSACVIPPHSNKCGHSAHNGGLRRRPPLPLSPLSFRCQTAAVAVDL